MMLSLVVAQVFSIVLFLYGLSCWIYPKHWTALMLNKKKLKHGALGIGIAILPYGTLIAVTHHIWDWTPIVLISIFGWLMLISGIGFIFHPQLPFEIWPSTEIRLNRANRILGVIKTILGAVLIYYTFFDIASVYSPAIEFMFPF